MASDGVLIEGTGLGRRTGVPVPAHAVLSDDRLARLATGGDERAFAAIFRRHHQPIYRYCRSLLRCDEDAQDALQNTFVKALRALPDEQRTIALKPWLYRVAHNESISLLRRRQLTAELTEAESIATPPAAEQADQRQRLRQLIEDLADLPQRQRAALLMRELGGLAATEIAQALNTTPQAATQAVYDARKALHEIEQGRAMRCEDVERAISSRDGRRLRSRPLRAHLGRCGGCRAFKASIAARHEQITSLMPNLPESVAASLLAGMMGSAAGGGGAGGAAAGVAAGGGAAIAGTGVKVLAGAAAVAALGAGSFSVQHTLSPTFPLITDEGDAVSDRPRPGHPGARPTIPARAIVPTPAPGLRDAAVPPVAAPRSGSVTSGATRVPLPAWAQPLSLPSSPGARRDGGGRTGPGHGKGTAPASTSAGPARTPDDVGSTAPAIGQSTTVTPTVAAEAPEPAPPAPAASATASEPASAPAGGSQVVTTAPEPLTAQPGPGRSDEARSRLNDKAPVAHQPPPVAPADEPPSAAPPSAARSRSSSARSAGSSPLPAPAASAAEREGVRPPKVPRPVAAAWVVAQPAPEPARIAGPPGQAMKTGVAAAAVHVPPGQVSRVVDAADAARVPPGHAKRSGEPAAAGPAPEPQ